MDSQEYEQLARETQAERVSLLLPALFARARQARENAQAARAVSADLRFSGQELTAVPDGDDATRNLNPEDERQRAKHGTTGGRPRKRHALAGFRKIASVSKH